LWNHGNVFHTPLLILVIVLAMNEIENCFDKFFWRSPIGLWEISYTRIRSQDELVVDEIVVSFEAQQRVL
jgi:hypothetical protein